MSLKLLGNRKQVLSAVCFAAAFFACGACKSSDDEAVAPASVASGNGVATLGSGSSAAPFSDLALLPPATGAVVAASGSLSLQAATGLPLATGETGEFGGSYDSFIDDDNLHDFIPEDIGSYGACELLNKTRGVYGQVGSADMMNCFLARTAQLDDDTFKFYSVSMGEGGTMKLRVRRINDDAGKVKALEVFTCSNGVQDSYFSADFSGGNVVMRFKGDTDPDNEEVDRVVYAATVTADGVSDEGLLEGEKTVEYRYRNLFTSGSNNHVLANIIQTASTFQYNGYSCERSTLTGDCDADRSESIFAYMEILNQNDEGEQDPNKFALGNGAAYLLSEGTDGIQQWTADDGLVANSTISDFGTYVEENRDDLLELSEEFSAVDFTAEETWDCADAAEEIPSDTLMEALSVCGLYSINQNVHLSCSQADLSKDTL